MRVPFRVIAFHGLGAGKDSDKYLLLGEEFPRAGLALARFDFRGCGESSGREDETTVATRLEDARAVLAVLEGHTRLDRRFGLLGSSLGGFVALHLAGAILHARAAEPCDLVIIPGGDHRLTDMGHRRAAVARSLEWLRRYLR